MTNDEAEKLLDEAEDLLRLAWAAMRKMGLRDRGSDISLSHEVRMFAAHFSEEGRDGPGALQIRGTGRFHAWLKAHRDAHASGVTVRASAQSNGEGDYTRGTGSHEPEAGGAATRLPPSTSPSGVLASDMPERLRAALEALEDDDNHAATVILKTALGVEVRDGR